MYIWKIMEEESFILRGEWGKRKNIGAIFSPFGYERWDSTECVV